jgi:hypothetical protein
MANWESRAGASGLGRKGEGKEDRTGNGTEWKGMRRGRTEVSTRVYPMRGRKAFLVADHVQPPRP